jgi:hypothetical protein
MLKLDAAGTAKTAALAPEDIISEPADTLADTLAGLSDASFID